MPSAFAVANSPLTSNGTIQITGAGTIAQYVRGDGTLETFPSLTGFVPYTGATQNVDLGEFGVDAGFVQLDTTPTNTPTAQGTIFWDVDDETVDVVLNGYIMKIGEDQFYPVKNQTGSSIAKGTAVRFAGTLGASGRLLIAPFIADGSVSSSFFMGVTAEAIANGADGKVLYFGRIRGINTNAFNEGDVLYASTTVAGGFQTAVPLAPNNIVQVAAVINKSINQGVIFVRPSFGSNINQDEGVKIVSPTTGQLLQLQANGLWENKTTAQVLGGTSSQFVKGDGTLDSNTYQVTSEKGQPNGYASLDSNGKVPLVQINDALIGNVNFQGLWNASTNTPTLANPPASGTKGYYYIVSTAGTFAGISFEVGDWIISDGTAWGKVDNTDAVSSVFGRTGNVVAANGDYTTAQVTESGNLYYTDGRARGALSFVAGSGAYNSTTGVITIPTNNNQITNGAGYITSAALGAYLPLTGGTLTGPLGGTSISLSGDITANRYRGVNSLVLNSYTTVNPSSNVYLYSPLNDRDAWIYLDSADTGSNWGIYHRQIDSAVSGLPQNSIGFIGGGTNTLQAWISLLNGNGFFAGTLNASNLSGTNTGNVTIETANGLSLSGQALSLGLASGSANGALSSTDWTTFNSKQNAGNYVTTDTTQTITGQKTISRAAEDYGGTTQSFLIDGASASGSLTLNSASTFYAYQTFAQGGSSKFEIGIVGTSNNGSFYINRNIQSGEAGSSIYIKKADGFVGINNITPSFQLDVTGRIRALTDSSGVSARTDLGGTIIAEGGTRAGLYILTSGTAAGSYGSIWWGNGNTNTDAFITVSNDTRAMAFGTADGTRLTLSSTGAATFSSSVTAGQLLLRNNSDSELINIGQSTGNQKQLLISSNYASNVFNIQGIQQNVGFNQNIALQPSGGNVLIGTTTDNGARLHVSGNTYLSADLRFGADFAGSNTAIIKWQGSGAAVPNSLGLFTWGDARDIQIGGKDVYFGAEGGATRVRITSGGNVLIGTTTDNGHKLQIGSTSTDRTSLSFSNTTTTRRYEVGLHGSSGTFPNRFFIFDDFANGYVFTIRASSVSRFHGPLETNELTSESATKLATINGNVLIGTTTDLGSNRKLQVAASGNTFSVLPTGGGVDLISSGNFAPHYITEFDFYLGVPGSGQLAMRINSSRNVLIGTTDNSGERLRVNGVGRFDSGLKTGPIGTSSSRPTWRLGVASSGTVIPDKIINVEIDGISYVFAAREN
jgi:hypothetical protein